MQINPTKRNNVMPSHFL